MKLEWNTKFDQSYKAWKRMNRQLCNGHFPIHFHFRWFSYTTSPRHVALSLFSSRTMKSHDEPSAFKVNKASFFYKKFIFTYWGVMFPRRTFSRPDESSENFVSLLLLDPPRSSEAISAFSTTTSLISMISPLLMVVFFLTESYIRGKYHYSKLLANNERIFKKGKSWIV